jgi:4-hydroxyphenylpyruvate dioxygenase-like putative hemolysin
MLYAVMKAGNATVVLVQGTSPESQVSRFTARFGAGMHHVAFTVTDLDEAVRRVTQAGGVVDTPVVQDSGVRQVFLRRDESSGVRVELIERKGDVFSEKNAEVLFRALEEKDLY